MHEWEILRDAVDQLQSAVAEAGDQCTVDVAQLIEVCRKCDRTDPVVAAFRKRYSRGQHEEHEISAADIRHLLGLLNKGEVLNDNEA